MFKFLKSIRQSFILLAVVILLIFLHYVGILGPLENLLINIVAPVQAPVYSAGSKINNLYSGIIDKDNLAQINEQLKGEVESLTIENVQLKIMLQENQEIQIQDNFLATAGYESITAKTIGKNPESGRQAIILNKGSNDGIKLGLPVVVGDGVLVGKISKVKSGSAEVILVNDSRSSIASMIQNEANSKGVVVGEHGLSLKMELIPQNDIVQPDDLVITSGLESNIPRGLVIGKINRIISEPNSFFQTAGVKPLVKIDNLIVVSVLTIQDYE